MFKEMRERFKKDRGDSVVTAIIVFPLLFMLLISIVDTGLYMGNRSQLNGIARDAARTVAIFGGNGTANTMTTLEGAYGASRENACQGITGELVKDAYIPNSTTAIECNVLKNIQSNTGLISVKLQKVTCTPARTTSIGQKVSCNIEWKYNGIPGSAIGALKLGEDQNLVATGTSESEVAMSQAGIINR